jgi:RIO kinase 1
MSGKEATVFVVRCGEEMRCAKVYKEANKRSFRQSVDYREGRKVRNSRQARAMNKGSRYGRKAQEESWQSTEVDALYRLAAAGRARSPALQFPRRRVADGARDRDDGNPAPRLSDVEFTAEQARAHHHTLMMQIVRMLCAGVVHGDLSAYNVLVDGTGPVVIDLPQAVDAAGNSHAGRMLERDVANVTTYLGRFAPELLTTEYGKEIWALYEEGDLNPEVELTGRFERLEEAVDVDSVVREIDDARAVDCHAAAKDAKDPLTAQAVRRSVESRIKVSGCRRNRSLEG